MSQDRIRALDRQHDSLLAVVFDRAALPEPYIYACCTSCERAWMYYRPDDDWCDADYKFVRAVVQSQLRLTSQT